MTIFLPRYNAPHRKDTRIVPKNWSAVNPSDPITVVTSFWFVKGSKNSKAQYESWIRAFLNQVTTNLVIFTSRESWEAMGNLPTKGNVAFVLDYKEPFEIPCATSLEEEYRAHQFAIDPHPRFAPELYAIWNAKGCLVNRVIRENPFNSKYFFWVDIGSVRNPAWNTSTEWPSLSRVKTIFKEHPDTPLFSMINPPEVHMANWTTDHGPFQPFLMQGGFFGGSRVGVKRFVREFWKLHDDYVQKGHFVGKDESLMNTLLSVVMPDSLIIPSFKLDHGPCQDIWFYFHQFMARDDQRFPGCQAPPAQSMKELLSEYYKPEQQVAS